MPPLTLPPLFIDRLTHADAAFREGNFSSAVTEYVEILTDVEKHPEVQKSDLASVVLKVAECNYAAGNFDSAKSAYEKLLHIQEEGNNISSKDRVFTLVKAAKNYEKCDDKINAQARYEQAYELAKSELPAAHFLRRTVLECYAQWLRAQKINPLMLSILESELGHDSTGVAEKESGATNDVTNANAPSSAGASTSNGASTSANVTDAIADASEARKKEPREQKKTAQDFNDIKAKLGKKSFKNDAPAAEPDTSDSKSESGESKKGANVFEKSKEEKSLERQVAARKFLNLSTNNNAKSNRSKLKEAMGGETGIVSDRDKLIADAKAEEKSKTPDLSANIEFQQAKKELAIEQENQDLLAEAESLLANLELAQQQKVAASKVDHKVAENLHDDEFLLDAAKKPTAPKADKRQELEQELEIERLLAESARLIYSLENSATESANEDEDDKASEDRTKLTLKGSSNVSMRGSERSFFGQEEEDKEPELEKENFGDKLEKLLPSTTKLNKSLKIGLPIGAVALIAGMALFSNANFKPDNFEQAPKFVDAFKNQDFSTADGALSIAFTPKGAEIHGKDLKRQPQIYFWQGTTNDELRLLQGTYKNCVWLRPSPDGIVTDKGQVFYSSHAPERKLIEIMDTLKNNALSYFRATGHYPNPEQIQPRQYQNPVTNRYDDVHVSTMIVGKDRPADADDRMDLDLENGQMFNNEPAPKPGGVNVFCVQVGEPIHTSGEPDNSYTSSFYIHAFNSKGELLKTGASQKIFLTELKPNGPKNNQEKSEIGPFKDCDICLTQSEVPSAVGVSFKYILFASLILGLVGFLAYSAMKKPEAVGEGDSEAEKLA